MHHLPIRRNKPYTDCAKKDPNMANLTLNVDKKTLDKARKVAIDQETTLGQMVREFLTSVAHSDKSDRAQTLMRLEHSFQRLSRDMGPRSWTREQLHER
jgi:hypothetical protein